MLTQAVFLHGRQGSGAGNERRGTSEALRPVGRERCAPPGVRHPFESERDRKRIRREHEIQQVDVEERMSAE